MKISLKGYLILLHSFHECQKEATKHLHETMELTKGDFALPMMIRACELHCDMIHLDMWVGSDSFRQTFVDLTTKKLN
jgi:hypothetical protein